MATSTHTSFLMGEPDGLSSDIDWIDDDGDFAKMPSDELDYLLADSHLQPDSQHSLGSTGSPTEEDAQPDSSSTQDGSEYQLTPSSTNELPNIEDSSFDLISNYTSSPVDVDQISPFSSQSSGYLQIVAPNGPNAAPSSSTNRSPESTGGLLSDSTQQQWSLVENPTEGDYVAALPEASYGQAVQDVPLQSTGALSENLLAGMNIDLVIRPSQQGQPFAAINPQPYTYGPSWGGLQQQQPIMPNYCVRAQPMQQTGQHLAHNTYTTSMTHVPNAYMGTAFSNLQYTGQQLPSQSTRGHGHSPPNQPSSSSTNITHLHNHNQPKELAYSTRLRFPDRRATSVKQNNSPVARQNPRPLAVADPARIPRQARSRKSEDAKRKPPGGRKKGDHLTQPARDRVSAMRKLGACWRCKLQRDPCPDDGTPCGRCVLGLQKGHQYYFECDRSKLPDFVMDFLPPSHTVMHSKQNIEDCVKDQVLGWDYNRPVKVYFSSGYGPPLPWMVYEFQPASTELLEQLQYIQDVSTGQSVRCKKWSPPLGILRLDPSDSWQVKNYLDELLTSQYLPDFAWRCFEEESQIDDFQATMLALICDLYRKTRDHDLSHLLRRILRMLMISYIMSHTLTITQETLPLVHHHLRSAHKPDFLTPFTSPRLANRQLKFFFHHLREEMFQEILKWQQTTLHTSGGKDTTWLSTFIVMLALAMVLEEGQRTIQIQADAKHHKFERSYAEAQTEAANACERIDSRFTLLVGLFQCKYRDKKWIRGGSFGPQTPRLRDPVEHEFCEELRGLLVERQDHLRSRKDVPFSSQTQCQYTTRLVARFLLPFLELPG